MTIAHVLQDLDLRDKLPGDLITAHDWNAVLDLLSDYDARLRLLEATSSGGPVFITRLVFTQPLRMGQTLEIQGRNFGVSRGAQVVQFDDRFIIQYGELSDDGHLFVTVPTDLPNITSEGRDVAVRVSNGGSSDVRTVRIFPIDVPITGNVVDITWTGVSPNPLPAGQSGGRLDFEARSRAASTIEFDVTIQISNAVLQAGARLVVGGVERPDFKISLPSLTDTSFSITLPTIPSSLVHQHFTTTVIMQSGTMFGSLSQDFPVGDVIIAPDEGITVNPDRMEVLNAQAVVDPNLGVYDAATNTIRLVAGRQGTMKMASTYETTHAHPATGNYQYCVRNVTGTGWSANIAGAACAMVQVDAGDIGADGRGRKTLGFTLVLAAGTTTGGEIEFTVVRQGNDNPRVVAMHLAPKTAS